MKGAITFLLFMAIAMVGIKWVINSPDPDVSDAMEYCQMVHAHQVDRSVGWPDFHHLYRQQCNADGTVNQAYITGR